MGMLCYDAYSFSFSFNIILHNLRNPTETTLRIIFIFYCSIAHCTLSVDSVCGCCWHFYIYIFYLKFALHFRAQVICQPFGCWLLCLFFNIFFSVFFLLWKNIVFDRDLGSQNLLFGLLRFSFSSFHIVVDVVVTSYHRPVVDQKKTKLH